MNNFAKLAALTLSLGILGSVSAQAAELPSGTEQASVYYGDLNLNNQAGVKTFIARIKTTAVEVCGGRPTNLDLAGKIRLKECTQQATAAAINRLDAATIAQVQGNNLLQVASKD